MYSIIVTYMAASTSGLVVLAYYVIDVWRLYGLEAIMGTLIYFNLGWGVGGIGQWARIRAEISSNSSS
jgi:hypothetical protein